MDPNVYFLPRKYPNYKLPPVVLTFIALFLSLVGNLRRFLLPYFYAKYYGYKMEINVLTQLFWTFLYMLPILLFLIYILGAYNETKSQPMLPVVFGAEILCSAASFILILYNVIRHASYFNDITNITITNITKLLADVVIIIVFSLGLYASFAPAERKNIFYFPLIGRAITTLALLLIYARDILYTLKNGMLFLGISLVALFVSQFLLTLALFWHCTKNPIRSLTKRPVYPPQPPLGYQPAPYQPYPGVPYQQPAPYQSYPDAPYQQPAPPSFIGPEQELMNLKNLYERGAISAEAYYAARAEVIKRL